MDVADLMVFASVLALLWWIHPALALLLALVLIARYW